MSPATGATGKPMSYLFPDLYLDEVKAEAEAALRRGLADPADCPHTHRMFKAGAWSCKRCGDPQ